MARIVKGVTLGYRITLPKEDPDDHEHSYPVDVSGMPSIHFLMFDSSTIFTRRSYAT
jgi:hypothetical protein